jgi:hypothetical protein
MILTKKFCSEVSASPCSQIEELTRRVKLSGTAVEFESFAYGSRRKGGGRGAAGRAGPRAAARGGGRECSSLELAGAGSANAAFKTTSRQPVPIDYTSGDRFLPDPALAESPYPVLNLFRSAPRRLIDKTAPFVAVAALRAKNRVLRAPERLYLHWRGAA